MEDNNDNSKSGNKNNDNKMLSPIIYSQGNDISHMDKSMAITHRKSGATNASNPLANPIQKFPEKQLNSIEGSFPKGSPKNNLNSIHKKQPTPIDYKQRRIRRLKSTIS